MGHVTAAVQHQEAMATLTWDTRLESNWAQNKNNACQIV